MKPFDIEKAKAGAKVCTRDGRKVRIVCFDRLGSYPLIVLADNSDVEGEPHEHCYACDSKGESASNCTTAYDLFMAEPEIPEGWIKYDPNVPPPENAEEIEYMCHFGVLRKIDLDEEPNYPSVLKSVRKTWKYRDGIIYWRVTKWKEEKQILEDTRNNVSREVYECMLHGAGSNLANLDNALQQFAEAIIQRAVEEARK